MGFTNERYSALDHSGIEVGYVSDFDTLRIQFAAADAALSPA